MGFELMLLALLAFLVFGPKAMPDITRQVGRTLADLKRTAADLQATCLAETAAPEETAALTAMEQERQIIIGELRAPAVASSDDEPCAIESVS